jgi:hypothetical protein
MVYEVFDRVNLSFLAMAHITLDDYFGSFASNEPWEVVQEPELDRQIVSHRSPLLRAEWR